MHRLPLNLICLAMFTGMVACGSRPTDSVGSAEQRSLSSVTSMVACPTDGTAPGCPAGSFSVSCADGSTEVDTREQIRSDQVCLPRTCGTGGTCGDAGTDDPLDPASCVGPMATLSDFAGRFQFGQKWLDLGSYHIKAVQQSCEPIGGCSPWTDAADPSALVLSFDGLPVDPGDLDGTLALENGGYYLTIWLRHNLQPTGAGCSTLQTDGMHWPTGPLANDKVGCSAYVKQGEGRGQFPALQVTRTDQVNFDGILTTHCARFSYEYHSGGTGGTVGSQTVKLATLVRF